MGAVVHDMRAHLPDAPPPADLGERLREIAARGAPEDALEPALRAVLEETDATAGAVCLFDSAKRLLRLVAEIGLSDEGYRRLRTLPVGTASAGFSRYPGPASDPISRPVA